MSTSRLFSLFVALTLAVAVVVTLRVGVGTSNLVNSGTVDAEAARWTAKAEFYAGQAQEAARIQRVQAADTARWVAMAKAYELAKHAPAQTTYDAETGRWMALAQFYAGPSAAQEAVTARWVAMGTFYATLEAQRMQRIQEAEAARWQALGEFYANKGQNSSDDTLGQQARDAIQVRWQAEHGGANRTCVLLCGGQ